MTQYSYVKNPSGHVQFESEKELYRFLEDRVFSWWKFSKQVEFAPSCCVDYLLYHGTRPVLVEVKNWFLRIKDMQQILKYYVHAVERYGEDNFTLIVIAGGIEGPRRKILEKLGVKVVLTKNLVNHYEHER